MADEKEMDLLNRLEKLKDLRFVGWNILPLTYALIRISASYLRYLLKLLSFLFLLNHNHWKGTVNKRLGFRVHPRINSYFYSRTKNIIQIDISAVYRTQLHTANFDDLGVQ